MTILWDAGERARARAEVLAPVAGTAVCVLGSPARVGRALDADPDERLLVIGPGADLDEACDLAEIVRDERPGVAVVLIRARLDAATLSAALRCGIREVVPDGDERLTPAVGRALTLTARWREPDAARPEPRDAGGTTPG